MFGGQTPNGEAHGEMHIMRVQQKKGLTWQSGESLCTGKGPEARFDHQMFRIRENLVIMGGRNRTNFITSVYLLDLCTLAWTKIAL